MIIADYAVKFMLSFFYGIVGKNLRGLHILKTHILPIY